MVVANSGPKPLTVAVSHAAPVYQAVHMSPGAANSEPAPRDIGAIGLRNGRRLVGGKEL